MNISVIVQARMGSTRLPGKVLMKVLGRSLLSYQIERLSDVKRINALVVATTDRSEDKAIVAECKKLGVDCIRGPSEDVLGRYAKAAQILNSDIVVRSTADCPIIDPKVLNDMIEFFLHHRPDYCSNNRKRTFPHGLDAEIFTRAALNIADKEDQNPLQREHVTGFITSESRFRCLHYLNPEDPEGLQAYSQYRWTVDFIEDFELVKKIIEDLYPSSPKFSWKDVLRWTELNPEFSKINYIHCH